MSLLGAALAGQKKYAEAEPLLIGGYEGLKAEAGSRRQPEAACAAAAADRPVLRGLGQAGQGGRVAGETGASAAAKPKP